MERGDTEAVSPLLIFDTPPVGPCGWLYRGLTPRAREIAASATRMMSELAWRANAISQIAKYIA